MKKQRRNRIIIGILVVILFVVVLTVSFHFIRERENIHEDLTNPDNNKGGVISQNKSDYSDAELGDIASGLRDKLINAFYMTYYYEAKDVKPDLDDETAALYFAYDETILNLLQEILTEETYELLLTKFEFVKEEAEHKYYLVKKEFLDTISEDSSILTRNVETLELVLTNATNERIDIDVEMNFCAQENGATSDEGCLKVYQYVLLFENEEWRIKEF